MTFIDRRKELLSVKNDERNLKEEFKEDAELPIFWLKVRKAFPLTAEKVEKILCSLLPPTGTMKLLTDEKAIMFMLSAFQMLSFFQD